MSGVYSHILSSTTNLDEVNKSDQLQLIYFFGVLRVLTIQIFQTCERFINTMIYL